MMANLDHQPDQMRNIPQRIIRHALPYMCEGICGALGGERRAASRLREGWPCRDGRHCACSWAPRFLSGSYSPPVERFKAIRPLGAAPQPQALPHVDKASPSAQTKPRGSSYCQTLTHPKTIKESHPGGIKMCENYSPRRASAVRAVTLPLGEEICSPKNAVARGSPAPLAG